jgi:predicted HAD superfamily Cof-like phosphohydrolase
MSIEKVAEFHKTFKSPILEKPQFPNKDRQELRVNLLQEELDEFKEAIKNKDIVEVADSLTDLQYVLYGALLEFGLGDKMIELFNEVHRSNMSKACLTEDEAKETCDFYYKKDGTETFYEERGGRWFVYRKGDGKSLKSINYSPADLKSILNGSN